MKIYALYLQCPWELFFPYELFAALVLQDALQFLQFAELLVIFRIHFVAVAGPLNNTIEKYLPTKILKKCYFFIIVVPFVLFLIFIWNCFLFWNF